MQYRFRRYRNRAALVLACLLALGCSQNSGNPPPPQSEPASTTENAAPTDPLPALKHCVFIILDAAHAGHFSYMGYERSTSPLIDEFASNAVAFTAAYSNTPNTLSSTRTFMTGQYAPEFEEPYVESSYGISRDTYTLARAFHERGFDTAGYSQNPYISPDFNFDAGFESFARYPRYLSPKERTQESESMPIERMLEDAKSWIEPRRHDAWFCYLHVLRPHNPYASPEPFQSRWNTRGYPMTNISGKEGPLETWLYYRGGRHGDLSPEDTQFLIDLYDGNLAYIDSLVGGFLDWLKHENLYDSTLVIIAADHGEAFMQHGFVGHNRTVYEEMIHIPLLFSKPKDARFDADRIGAPVAMIDLFPTLADLFDLQPPAETHGRSLLPYLRNEAPQPTRPVFAHVNDKTAFAVRIGDYKVLFQRDSRQASFQLTQVFDLKTNPAETVNLADDPASADIRAQAQQAFDEYRAKYWSQPVHANPNPEVSTEIQDELRALGYVGGDPE